MPSILMIDQEQKLLNLYRDYFNRHFPGIPFFTMNHPDLGRLAAEIYQPDLIVTEICFPLFDFYDGEKYIQELGEAHPKAGIIVYTVYDTPGLQYQYETIFGVDAYLPKLFTKTADVIDAILGFLEPRQKNKNFPET